MGNLTQERVHQLSSIAKKIRIDILEMITKASSGHTGGSLSIADLITLLYFEEMNIDPENPQKSDRDRLVLSKGHAAPAIYAALAEKGYFAKEELFYLRQANHMLQGHPDMKHTPGVDMTTGSLGQGISAACGMALSAKMDNADWYVYTVLGDGELEEGQVWEAAMSAAAFGLDNVCAILDYNKIQLDGPVNEVLSIGDVRAKWEAFGWNAIEINGHDIAAIDAAFESAMRFKGKPSIIIAHTIKGKGVSFMENTAKFHGLAPTDEELAQALEELK